MPLFFLQQGGVNSRPRSQSCCLGQKVAAESEERTSGSVGFCLSASDADVAAAVQSDAAAAGQLDAAAAGQSDAAEAVKPDAAAAGQSDAAADETSHPWWGCQMVLRNKKTLCVKE